jgi:transcription antitermination factor NusG
MSERILALLNSYNGREVVLDAGQDADWRERRPEIIIPLTSQQASSASADKPGQIAFAAGQKVRILQSPYLGEIGTITSVEDKPRRLPGGHWLAGAHIEVDSDETIFVPFANLEHLG